MSHPTSFISDSNLTDIKWDALQRFEEIERWLYWQGSLSRSDLALKFKMSKQQTSAILKQYQQLNPKKIELNNSTKRYIPNDTRPNLFYQPTLADLTLQAEQLNINNQSFMVPSRRFPLEIARDLARAIFKKQSLEIIYHSQKDPTGKVRRISPHSFVNTSKRVHVRAWCHQAKGYRDFIIGRITETSDFSEAEKGLEHDKEWHNEINIKLIPNPCLNADQKKLIELDFNMVQGVRRLTIKQAMLPYYMELYTLWPNYEIDNPIYQPVVLESPDDVLCFF